MIWMTFASVTLAQPQALEVTTHTVEAPEATGDPDADRWLQYQVFGTFTNHTDEIVELPRADLTFHGADGATLGVDSIGTASRRDAGRVGPEETLLARVHFVRPGETVPFHFLRNLAAVHGTIGSHELEVRPWRPWDGPAPHGELRDVEDTMQTEGTLQRRVLTGTLANAGDAPCLAPSVVVAVLDEDEHIVDLSTRSVGDASFLLGPGASMPVRVSLSSELARSGGPVRTWVDCRPVR